MRPAQTRDKSSVIDGVVNLTGAWELIAWRGIADAANRTWSKLLLRIEDAFSGDLPALVPAVHSTFDLRDQALVRLARPLPDPPGRRPVPKFEWSTS